MTIIENSLKPNCDADRSPDYPDFDSFLNPFHLTIVGEVCEDFYTLITRLVDHLSRTMSVVVIADKKMEAHFLSSIKSRKNVFTKIVLTNDYAIQCISKKLHDDYQTTTLTDFDIVLILGKNIPVNTKRNMVIHGSRKNCHDRISELEHVIAFCGQERFFSQYIDRDIPCFLQHNITSLVNVIIEHFHEESRKMPLFGLVLVGGKSTRMKQDKALIQYHDTTQVEFCYNLLSARCDKVYVSSRDDQKFAGKQQDLPHMYDRFKDFGPLGAILTALHIKPNTAWLVLACDLPLVDDQTICNLIQKRSPHKMATAYRSSYDQLPEPLCTIYEPKSIYRLMHFLAMGYKCPRKILIHSNIHLISLANEGTLFNANNVTEYQQVINLLESSPLDRLQAAGFSPSQIPPKNTDEKVAPDDKNKSLEVSLNALYSPDSPSDLNQSKDGDTPVVVKKKTGGRVIQNPSDPDATYDGKKGPGYQVQFSETCSDANEVQLITAHVQKPHVSQIHMP